MAEAEPFVSLLNSLERATHMTKCLPSATSPEQLSLVYDSLRDAQIHIQNFLLQQQQPEYPERDEGVPSKPLVLSKEEENEDEPMQETEEYQKEVHRLQESIADRCGLYSKRRKRVSSVEDDRIRFLGSQQHKQKPSQIREDLQHNLDLIFQFHV